ncbi:MAG: filamentous hemagglutinin N-terminal domain-containing protein [Cyanobacteria bacterium J06632_19]
MDCYHHSAVAQITATPNDAGTVVNQNGNQLKIEGGTEAGKNLFHSFDKFGVNEGQTANFISKPEIKNILGRVKGGDASVINGLIQVTGGNSNLYLMNPAGIIFGQGSSLNVPGAFTATTANGIGFGDKWFNALGANDYAELIANPDAFAFTQAGAILNEGNLAVKPGQNLTLLGGTVINTGKIEAPGGNITVAAVPEEKLVKITQEGNLLSLGLPVETKAAINNQPFTPLSLPQLLTGGNFNGATGVEVENGVVKLTGSGVEIPNDAGTAIVSNQVDVSGKVGGTVNVLGEKVGIIGGDINVSGKNAGGTALIGGDYKGEGTVPNAKTTFISQDSTIKADAEVAGNGGKVIAWADKTTVFKGKISARGGKTSGDGGFVEVSGKENLGFDGFVDVGADFGEGGKLLLDPATVIIDTGLTANDSVQLGDQEILFPDPGVDNVTFSISPSTVIDALKNGDVTIEATDNIDVNSGILESRVAENYSDLTLNAPSINIDANIQVGGNLNLLASNDLNIKGTEIISWNENIEVRSPGKVNISEIGENAGTPVILNAQGNINITGNEGIEIKAFENSNSYIRSGGDLNLVSDGDIIGNARISSVGNFSADNGNASEFNQALSLNGIISSNGDVSFDDYTGSSLKVEAKGSILVTGDINITDVGTFPQTDDPDIAILNAAPSLILRAGVENLRHSPDNPSSTPVNGTPFTFPNGELPTTTTLPGSIEVKGNINPDAFTSGHIILSATGDINTGFIQTADPRSKPVIADSVNIISTQGKVIVDYIRVAITGQNVLPAGINIESKGVFQAQDSYDFSTSFGGGTLTAKASITTPGKISIKHGGESFQPALELEQDSNGLVFRVDKLNDQGIVIGRQVVPTGDGGSSAGLVFSENEAGEPVEPVEPVGNNDITVKEVPFPNNLSENTSYTAGGIFLNRNATDSGMYGSFPDAGLEGDTNIDIPDVPPTTNPGGGNSNGGGGTSNPDGGNSDPGGEEVAQRQPNDEVVQRQLNKEEQSAACSPQKSNTAGNTTENTSGENATNNSQSTKDNPCRTIDNNNNILKVIEDNRTNSNSALPTFLFRLGKQ